MNSLELKPIKGSDAAKRKCLLGITIMLVEDSLCASEALRLMAVASGARLRRADRLSAAQRHLAAFRPNVVIVDMGLPDGSGLDLITEISRTATPCPALIAVSGGEIEIWGQRARAAGADAVLEKPIGGIAAFQDVVLSVLPDGEARREGRIPQPFLRPASSVDVIREDLSNAKELLKAALAAQDGGSLAYAGQFISSVAVMMNDKELEACAAMVTDQGDEFHERAQRFASDLLKMLEKRQNWDVLTPAVGGRS